MKKKYGALVFLLIAATVYVVFYHQDKTLKYVPQNTEILVLIDTKKCTRQYISEMLTHPAEWMKKGKTDGNPSSLRETGLKIPGFLPIFHLQQTPISQWYSVLEIEDEQKLLTYLKQHQFIRSGKNTFKKDLIFLNISDGNCLIGTSDLGFKNISNSISSGKNDYRADSFIDGSPGSISFISGPRTRNFSIDIHDHDIEVKNSLRSQDFNTLISNLENKNIFLEAESDAGTIKQIAGLFGTTFTDDTTIESLQATAQLEQVNDTIITYGYDDNFNEIEKKAVQKILQPNYAIALHTADPEKALRYFQEKKWINDRNQFTAIPFQPNRIVQNKTGLEITSTRKSVKLPSRSGASYIFVKNNPLLLSGWKTGSPAEKKIMSQLDYLFCANRNDEFYVKLQFKKDRLPLLLRY